MDYEKQTDGFGGEGCRTKGETDGGYLGRHILHTALRVICRE